MQAVSVPFGPMRSGASLPPPRQRRGRALLVVALLVALGHAFLLGGVGVPAPEAGRAGGGSPLSVRVVAAAPSPEAKAVVEAASADPAPAAGPIPPVAARAAAPALMAPVRRLARRAPESMRDGVKLVPTNDPTQAGARSTAASAAVDEPGPGADEPQGATVAAVALPAPADVGASGVPAAPSSTLLQPNEEPPPIYRTRLPPALTLRYEVRSGFLRGDGELRWRPQGDTYSLALEARVSGLTLLRQSSDGELGGEGLAPVRFLDQRARRSAQAANFRREAGKITFSGPATEWPLLPGSQDRLSFLVQLAGIAAGDPALLIEGARIVMVVAGARGDASVWSFRCLGPETIETGVGTVHAIKFVRDARSTYDTTAEIWLDPARYHLPAHATLRNRSGASEVDLLLDGVDTAPP